MSQAIYICYRKNTEKRHGSGDLKSLSRRLSPDNITPNKPIVIENENTMIGIFNPVNGLNVVTNNVYLGQIVGKHDDWWRVGTDAPDGTYAMFRGNAESVEILSDVVGSRTIWYVHTDNVFIASTSQRAIVFFLESFEPNVSVYPWMLSSGTLGPGLSWDRRIRCLPGDACLKLDRQTWRVKLEKRPVCFESRRGTKQEMKERLQKALESTFENINLDLEHWVLPLSGGYDSRVILLMLREKPRLRTITWGLSCSLMNKLSDAYVARKLADYFKLQHEFFETDLSEEPIETIFDRFVVAGEGRIDHISAYMDGFNVWKVLRERNVDGVMRGDEGFGWVPVKTEFDARKAVGLTLVTDYEGLAPVDKQDVPLSLVRKPDESTETYRDRLYHEFRLPVIMAALNDLKCAYVEVVNPLLSRRIINEIRNLPDSLRTDKVLFKRIVRKMSPNIAYATERAIAFTDDVLKRHQVTELLKKELRVTQEKELFSNELIEDVLNNMAVINTNPKRKSARLKNVVKAIIPRKVKTLIRRSQNKMSIDYNLLAFRIYIVSKMHKILTSDSRALGDV